MKHIKLINQMTLEEKASLMSGENFWNTKAIERLGIPSIMMTDGPHGVRKQAGKADHLGLNKSIPATCFPTAATIANSWDRELIYSMGEALGQECVKENVSVLLGPGINIKRNPLCGRNFEYFSEDPYLTGELGVAMVKGMQSQGISACPKHYAVNSQEHMRMTIDEIVDERSLREIYLPAFEKVVKEGHTKTLMSSYNQVNGEFANEHTHLMNEILFDEWGYEGVVVTDWGGNNDRVAGLKAHNQLEMPATNGITDLEIVKAVKEGFLEERVLDEAVSQLLTLIFDTSQVVEKQIEVDLEEQHQKAVAVASESLVLLKNGNKLLPIKDKQSIGIIGDFAKEPRYQGAGSSLINPTKLPNALEVLSNSELAISGYAKGFLRRGKTKEKLVKEAVELSQQVETVLLFVGLDESAEAEGIDRAHLSLPENQLHLIDAISQVNPNIVLIIAGGGVIEMPFINQVRSVLHTYLAGQGGAEAICNVLLGKTNPSGKLSETYPITYEDTPSAPFYPGKEVTAEHREGLFIGYRYFDTFKKEVLFPFGFGLSYTTFAYENLMISGQSVSLTVTNTGEVAGSEIVQLYVEKEDSQIFRAKRELKGFEKIHLEVGESKRVQFDLSERDFSFYSIHEKKWLVEAGTYGIHIGASLLDTRLFGTIEIEGEEKLYEYSEKQFPHYYSGELEKISDVEYTRLLGHKPPAPLWDRDKSLGMNDTIAQARSKHWLGKTTYGVVAGVKNGFMLIDNPIWSNNMYFVINMPFRQIERFTGGKISNKMVKGYLNVLNKNKKKKG
ncbi:glycoside hydrolase family 3 C-terminal domain-containing protein [Vagococcus sp. DIV0080]|uniref:Glycoside hydrolase family 3 C-terminal domain-containing protein n=1 Tax=Candidatus Vagococcus giribetii TaxID=2230876 RepID=A0ABS3HWT2_9ENTE|nr:glycoside hydrolase family 3 C-terminal domain-containing protein [Vagococcus sp. DIV0080]MBO0477647.1 glycoside hydrolase family 3 C-terminal domain-containing protein [Vagococcus sp. DIV0080]